MAEPIFEKKCKGPCGRTLPLAQFPKQPRHKRDGHAARCKECVKASDAARQGHPDFHITVTEKVCTSCKGDPQPVANFQRDKNQRDGFGSQCKTCRRPAQRAYYQDNRDAAIASVKAYSKAHPERTDATLKNLAQWAKDNPEKVREANKKKARARRARLREEAIITMGGICVCCGENDWRLLTFDHIGGWGAEHRRELNHAMLIPWLKKHHFPKGGETCPECGVEHRGIQIMCFTCNMATTVHGICPHQQEFNIVAMAMEQQVALAA
jgi:hypothetical protein